MKQFQFIHATVQLGAYSIMLTEQDILKDNTIPQEDKDRVMSLDINERCLCRFGTDPVKTANIIRKG